MARTIESGDRRYVAERYGTPDKEDLWYFPRGATVETFEKHSTGEKEIQVLVMPQTTADFVNREKPPNRQMLAWVKPQNFLDLPPDQRKDGNCFFPPPKGIHPAIDFARKAGINRILEISEMVRGIIKGRRGVKNILRRSDGTYRILAIIIGVDYSLSRDCSERNPDLYRRWRPSIPWPGIDENVDLTHAGYRSAVKKVVEKLLKEDQ